MEELTFPQKVAIMRILLDIINADGRIDIRETEFYNKVATTLGLSVDEREQVAEANSLLALLQIKNFTDEQKKFVSDVMGQQIVVDTDINVNEIAIYELVCNTCDIQQKFEDSVTKEQLENSTRS